MTTARAAPLSPLVLSPRDWAMLVTLSVLWGGSFFFAKIAVAEIPPLTLVALRVAIAAAALHLVLFALGEGSPLLDRRFPALVVLGIFNNVIPFSLLFWAQQSIPSGLASILNATTPIFTVILATLLTADDKATPLKVGGIALGFLGVVIMLGTGSGGGGLLPQIACLGAACSYGVANMLARRLTSCPPMTLATGQLTASTLVMVPLSLVLEAPWTLPVPSATAISAVLAIALLTTALAYLLFFAVLKSAGATNASLVTYLVPVSAILLGTVFLGERLGAADFAGMALIIGGIALAQGRLRRPRRAAGA